MGEPPLASFRNTDAGGSDAEQGSETMKRGPGRLVLVVGPSGAGKDTLLREAAARIGSDPAYVFARRTITRPPSVDEDNDSCDLAAFEALAERGGFAMAWEAHGLRYGVPAAIDAAITDGRTVICNVSRRVVAAARARYADVFVILVSAPAQVLRDRVRARGRPQDGDLESRVARSTEIGAVDADLLIDNAGPVEAACARLLAALDPVRATGSVLR